MASWLALAPLPAHPCQAQDRPRPQEDRDKAQRLIERGAQYLLAAQEKDGGWGLRYGPGVSCLVLKALIQDSDVGADSLAVRRGIQAVLRHGHDDGGIYGDGLLKNYETSVALSMFAATRKPEYDAGLKRMQQFLIDNQWDEADGKSIDDAYYGGAGYGRGKRPDLSNTQMMLEALRDSGLPPDDPTYQKALVFISRCQMRGESNDQKFARGSNDGGFIYTPVDGGESKAGKWKVDGRRELRSYGTMTYSGFKSMLYAGLTRDDPRVRAAWDWIGRNWTLDVNPNMPARQSREGLYYYYHVFARALQAAGVDEVTDSIGRRHDWRAELVEKLDRLQKRDGSWENDKDRWMEGQPALTTAYALLALQAAFPPDSQPTPKDKDRSKQSHEPR